jgi:hypothetical protein
VVLPANSVTFPNTPNCSFYQWSMQMFLWLTSPAPVTYGGGGRIFDTSTFFDVATRPERRPHLPATLPWLHPAARPAGRAARRRRRPRRVRQGRQAAASRTGADRPDRQAVDP